MYTFKAQFSVTPVPIPSFRSLSLPGLCRSAAAAVVATALAACSPQYNWREMLVADGQVRAAFPARVQTETRTVRLGDISTPFTVVAASVDDATFAVGHARLPPDIAGNPANRAQLAGRLLVSAYTNLGAAVPPYVHAASAHAVVVRGQGTRQGTWSLVKVFTTRDGVVQAIAMGRDSNLTMARAREFVDRVVMAP